jgi:hypothetical protein
MVGKRKKRSKSMKTIIQSSKTPAGRLCSAPGVILIAFALTSLALPQRAQALSPAPDGGYPGLNTAEGQNALLGLTTGTANTAVGWFSLKSNTDGTFNTAIGAATLLSNVGNQSTGEGVNNTAIGGAALLFNTIGFNNTAVGAAALLHNINGSFNTATGVDALFFNTASGNTAVGSKALLNNTTGGTLGTTFGEDVGPNTAVGSQALQSNMITSGNTAVGYQALGSYTTGFMNTDLATNTAVGFQALGNATGGDGNCGFGYRTLYNNTDGRANTALGQGTLLNNTAGGFNTGVGGAALTSNTTGSSNTVIGFAALANSTGSNNTALGYQAGSGVLTGNNNICIGVGASAGDTSDTIVIGGGQTTTYIEGIFGATVGGGTPVLVGSGHKLGTTTSSKRFKRDIKPMDQSSETLLSLKPVTFRYKKEVDPSGVSQFGLVAEEVEKVNPDLVVRDKDGKPYSVRYDQVNVMLLNEFLKEHKKVQQLEADSAQQRNDFAATIAELRKEIAGVVARSRDQDDKIRKVSAQVELNKTVSRKIANQ